MSGLPSHLELVQGVVLPRPVGGDPVLDFVNTRSHWTGPDATEWLTSYEALVIWAGYAGMLPDARVFRLIAAAAAKPTESSRRLRAALDLRADLHDVLTGASDSVGTVARTIEKATARRQLICTGEAVAWELPEDLALPIDTIAIRAGDLLTGPARGQVRSCAGCGWLFLDPRGRRRWCSMATCGNRAKVRAHAARSR